MSYDKWKLSNPQDDGWTSDEVTSCCGAEERVKENLCDDRQIFYCSECGEVLGLMSNDKSEASIAGALGAAKKCDIYNLLTFGHVEHLPRCSNFNGELF